MSDCVIDLGMNVDINILLNQIEKIIGTTIYRTGITSSSPKGYDRFISILNSNQVISCYYHPNSRHSATASGKTKAKTIANAGQWAVAVAMRGLFGNAAHYDTL